MDVTLPDGTTLKDVPEGTTKAQIAEKMKAGGHDVPADWLSVPPPKPSALSEFGSGLTEPSGLLADTARFAAEKAGVAQPLAESPSMARSIGRYTSGIGLDIGGAMLAPQLEVPAALGKAGSVLRGTLEAAKLAGYGGAATAAEEASKRGELSDVKAGDVAKGAAATLATGGTLKGLGAMAEKLKQPVSESYKIATDYLKSIGAKLSPAQESGGPKMLGMEKSLGEVIPTGSVSAAKQAKQIQEVVNKKINETAGIKGPFTEPNMQAAFKDAGSDINSVMHGKTFDLDPTERQELLEVVNLASPGGQPLFHGKALKAIQNVANGGTLTGEEAQLLRSEMGRIANDKDNGSVRYTFGQALETLDDSIKRNVMQQGSADEVAKLGDARKRYRTLIAVKDLWDRGSIPKGDYDASKIMDALTRQTRNQSGHPLFDIAHAGRELNLKPYLAGDSDEAAKGLAAVGKTALKYGPLAAAGAGAAGVSPVAAPLAAAGLAAPLLYRGVLATDKLPPWLYNLLTKSAGQGAAQGASNGILSPEVRQQVQQPQPQ